jgi:hypothetical protein
MGEVFGCVEIAKQRPAEPYESSPSGNREVVERGCRFARVDFADLARSLHTLPVATASRNRYTPCARRRVITAMLRYSIAEMLPGPLQ